MAASDLSPEEQGKRLRIARELAGVSREELGQRFAEEGFGKNDPAAIERQAERTKRTVRRVQFTPARRELAAQALRVPPQFFTEPDYSTLFASDEADGLAQLRRDLESQIQDLKAEVDLVAARQHEDDLAADERTGGIAPRTGELGNDTES